MEQAALKWLALPSKTPLPVLSFGSIPVSPVFSFGSLGYGVVRPFYFIFLALFSSKDETIVYSVDGMVVDKEVDDRVVKQGVFK